ncbi:hypothetical protein TrST_g11110 [Triparma strigata]|uniref:GPI transamidase subunit PIG-U n=1 Tax=Triparma strigata TaxID=1606541 RepID=A0A9W7EQP0_9STRA|nr:hypothetical protein TrST_g11110 [Triparma strigata]
MRKRRSPSASASAVFRSIRSFVEEHDTLSAVVAGSIVFRLFYENSEFGFVSNLTSVSRIQEGLRFSSVADAVYVSNQPPLVLLFYDSVLSCLPLSLFNILCDAAGSLALFELCRLNLQHESLVEEPIERVMDERIRPPKILNRLDNTNWKLLVAAAYFVNPLSTAVPSTQPLSNFLVLLSIMFALRPSRNIPASMSVLALATYVTWWPIGLLAPLLCCLSQPADPPESSNPSPSSRRPKLAPAGTVILGLTAFASAMGLLLAVSSWTVSPSHPTSWEWIHHSYYHWATFQDLTPNVGLYWYFFAQIFSRFRTYFLVTFNVLPFLLVAPILIRLKEIPVAAIVSLVSLFNILAPYPTFGSVTFSFLLMLSCPRSVVRLRFISMFCLIALPVPSVLLVAFWRLWAIKESGNGNYVYFQQLAYTVFAGLIALDFLSASVSRIKALKLTRKPAAKLKTS